MISRGHYIGAIVDEFATIAEKVAMRNHLHLFDLTQHAEAYFKEVLNLTFGWALESLNNERSNEPGLDLGDRAKHVGVQVTSSAGSKKINDTLAALTDEQKTLFSSKVIVLVVGKKQGSYSIDPVLMSGLPFSAKNIWDLTRVAREIMSLDIKDLQELYRYVTEEGVRIRFELEIPDEQGNFPTTNYDRWEPLAEPKVGDGSTLVAYCRDRGFPLDDKMAADVREAVADLADRLKRMPRMTREFLAMLIERREKGEPARRSQHLGTWNILTKLQREYQSRDLVEELALLETYEFVSVDGDDPGITTSPEVFVSVSRNDDLSASFVDFVLAKKLSLRDVIGKGDLSAF